MRTRVLFVNEFSCQNSGYSKYGFEVLKRLSQKEDIQIAELATYASAYNPKDVAKSKSLPWDVYFNYPDRNNPEQMALYNKSQSFEFGNFRFNEVCAEFKPHIVMDIRDWWMQEFQERSPYRDRFHWTIMTTVDAEPQHEQWIYTFCNADGVFSYTDWGEDVLRKTAGEHINLLGTAPPCAEKWFTPADKMKAKEKYGICSEFKIVGTVMRNQGRKLFADLFDSFRKFLDTSNRNDVFLYCHTCYPDGGWDIPELLKRYQIASRTIFTYKCYNCGFIFPRYYQGIGIACPHCYSLSAKLPSVEDGVSEQHLAKIMQTFDLYVQYANSEGFGMPQVEAAMSGIPVVGLNYSAMSDVIDKVEGKAINPLHLATEANSGRLRAIPDNEAFVDYLREFFSLPMPNRLLAGKKSHEAAKKAYNWDDTADKWYQHFKTVDIEKYEAKWFEEIVLREPAKPNSSLNLMSNNQYVEWLITSVLCDPSKLNSYLHMRLLRDLNNGVMFTLDDEGSYFNESTKLNKRRNLVEFDRNKAYNHVLSMCNNYNLFESKRLK